MIYAKFLYLAFGVLNLQIGLLVAENDILNMFDDKRNQISKSEKLFKAGFLEARLQHIEALNHIRKSMNYEKQYKLTLQVFQKLFDILLQTKSILENSDYVPALDFPSNQTVIEALGQILDNTALYGEFQLKLPDITDRIMKKQNDWMVLIKWAIGFSNSTGLYDAKTTVMLNLVCQEMNLIERTENFINPYRKSKPETWTDFMYQTRRKAARIKESQQKTGGGEALGEELNDLELCLLNLIWWNWAIGDEQIKEGGFPDMVTIQMDAAIIEDHNYEKENICTPHLSQMKMLD